MENKTTQDTCLIENTLDQTPLLIAYLDQDFNFIKVNRAYAAADQKDPSFYPGKNHFALYPDIVNQAIFQNVVDTGKPYATHAKPFVYKNNPERGITYWDWTVMPVKYNGGEVTGLLLTLLDVTDQVTGKPHP